MKRFWAIIHVIAPLLITQSVFGQGTPTIAWLGGGHSGGINAVAVTTDGKLWTAGRDSTIKQ